MQEGGFGGKISCTSKSAKLVETVSLETIVKNHKNIDFLKIDVEGAENYLDWENIDLANVQAIFIEYHSIPGTPQSLDLILRCLKKHGFRSYITEACPHPIFPKSLNCAGFDNQLNICAFRPCD